MNLGMSHVGRECPTLTQIVSRQQSVIHVGWTGQCIHPYRACPTLAEPVPRWLSVKLRRLSLNQAKGQGDVLYATFLLFSHSAETLFSPTQLHDAVFDLKNSQ
jgi:hypothetical protein